MIQSLCCAMEPMEHSNQSPFKSNYDNLRPNDALYYIILYYYMINHYSNIAKLGVAIKISLTRPRNIFILVTKM